MSIVDTKRSLTLPRVRPEIFLRSAVDPASIGRDADDIADPYRVGRTDRELLIKKGETCRGTTMWSFANTFSAGSWASCEKRRRAKGEHYASAQEVSRTTDEIPQARS